MISGLIDPESDNSKIWRARLVHNMGAHGHWPGWRPLFLLLLALFMIRILKELRFLAHDPFRTKIRFCKIKSTVPLKPFGRYNFAQLRFRQ